MNPSHAVRRAVRLAMRGVSLRAGRRPSDGCRRDRGAVLVHVAVAMTGLLAFSAMTIDLGTLWVARGQAQNAADAAALSGGAALAYIDETDEPAAIAAADAVARAHFIWGEQVAPASLTTTVAACPAGAPAMSGSCLNIAVQRPLPVFFSSLFGASATNLRASASAMVMLGNATSCLRPLAIVDRWTELRGAAQTFDAYDAAGTVLPGVIDQYDEPDAASPGSGWALSDVRPSPSLTFRLTDPALPVPPAADQMIAFDLARPGGDPDPLLRYEENLGSCGGAQTALGDVAASIHPPPGHTIDPLVALVGADPGTDWDDGPQAVRGSPRLITIAVIDPDHFSSQNRTGGAAPVLRVRNLIGFFVEDAFDSGGGAVVVRGRLAITSGIHTSEPTLANEASFLRTVALVR